MTFKNYLSNPFFRLTVIVIGAGGTGSQLLNALAKISVALHKLKGIDLNVTVYDGDEVSTSNVARQMFSYSEIGMNKASALCSKINRTYNVDFEAVPEYWKPQPHYHVNSANFIFTCVDVVSVRKQLYMSLLRDKFDLETEIINDVVTKLNYYWFDLGNTRRTGNVIVGSYEHPSIIDLYPNLQDDPQTPSCSLLEALNKQDLFVNTFCADIAAKMFWDLLMTNKLKHSQAYFNLDTLKITTKNA